MIFKTSFRHYYRYHNDYSSWQSSQCCHCPKMLATVNKDGYLAKATEKGSILFKVKPPKESWLVVVR